MTFHLDNRMSPSQAAIWEFLKEHYVGIENARRRALAETDPSERQEPNNRLGVDIETDRHQVESA
jgi:hypothetical protein